MKTRVFKAATFFAFNLLFFALYLNFIYSEGSDNRFDQVEPAKATVAFGATPQEASKVQTTALNSNVK